MVVGHLLDLAARRLKEGWRDGEAQEVWQDYEHPAHLAWDPATLQGDAYPAWGWGVSAVEVSIDDGDWQAARLSVPLTDATWVQWSLPWVAGPTGAHTIRVRATDGTGEVQTDEVTSPAPDGARGHHSVVVTVA
jgi:hypothetical protein